MTNKLVRKVGGLLAVPVAALAIGGAGLAAPQKAEAEGMYAGANIGYFSPSDQGFQKIYGGMVKFGGEVGYKANSDVRIGLGLEYGSASGTPITSGNTSGYTLTAKLSELSVEARVSKGFDLGVVVPYIGIEGSYNSFNEYLSDNVGDSISANVGDWGYGAFLGAEFKIPNSKIRPFAEFKYDSIPITNSTGGVTAEESSPNGGGLTISGGARIDF